MYTCAHPYDLERVLFSASVSCGHSARLQPGWGSLWVPFRVIDLQVSKTLTQLVCPAFQQLDVASYFLQAVGFPYLGCADVQTAVLVTASLVLRVALALVH